jgi:hypothetical protein
VFATAASDDQYFHPSLSCMGGNFIAGKVGSRFAGEPIQEGAISYWRIMPTKIRPSLRGEAEGE